jgi:hypothetical protein
MGGRPVAPHLGAASRPAADLTPRPLIPFARIHPYPDPRRTWSLDLALASRTPGMSPRNPQDAWPQGPGAVGLSGRCLLDVCKPRAKMSRAEEGAARRRRIRRTGGRAARRPADGAVASPRDALEKPEEGGSAAQASSDNIILRAWLLPPAMVIIGRGRITESLFV